MAATGSIINGGVTRLALAAPGCPTCGASVEGVRRYAAFTQVQALPETIDRMYAKFGRKLDMFVSQMFLTEELLTTSFNFFSKKLRPGPLAGKHNQSIIWERGNAMMEVQQRITRFRDEFVVPFEDSLVRLARFLDNPGILKKPRSAFKIRYDFLYYRCRLITLEDASQLCRYITKLGQSTQHSSTLAEGLRMLIKEQALKNIKALEIRISDCNSLNLKRLEVELRLAQVCFHMLCRFLDTDSGVDVKASLRRVALLCQRYPDTAGNLYRSYRTIKAYVDGGPAPKRLYDVYGNETRGLWRDLGKHKTGNLAYCVYDHPYSTSTFPNCPECGKEVDAPPPREPIDYNSFLHEDDFLAAMMKKT
ncbi:hypothetical protein MMC24_000689 [Lignoscripta atroalba]|nr:hypothetical protein [Lignoscripta atroalba]